MIPPFDIFQTATDGNARWLESAATLRGATAGVQAWGTPQPSEYLILDQKTGRQFVVKPDGMAAQLRLNDPRAITSQSVTKENRNGE